MKITFVVLFLLLRVLDISTTSFHVAKNGIFHETNPFIALILKSYGIGGFIAINGLISLALAAIFYYTFSNSISKSVLLGFLILNTIVVISNVVVVSASFTTP